METGLRKRFQRVTGVQITNLPDLISSLSCFFGPTDLKEEIVCKKERKVIERER